MIKRIATAVVLIPVVLLLVLKAPPALLVVVTGAVALAAVHEFLQLVPHYGVDPFRLATYIFVALFFGAIAMASSGRVLPSNALIELLILVLAAVLAPFVFLTLGMTRGPLASGYPAAAASVFAFAYIALPMALLLQLRSLPSGAFLVIYLLVVVWAGDIFAYFVGKSMGRNLLAPRVSPKKTWEGAIASVAASVGFGALLFYYALPISTAVLQWHLMERRDGIFGLQQPSLWPIVAVSVVANVAAQLGDLVESLIKRGANVKDSGTLLPGHGGILDRIDALLFAAPVVWCYAVWAMQ